MSDDGQSKSISQPPTGSAAQRAADNLASQIGLAETSLGTRDEKAIALAIEARSSLHEAAVDELNGIKLGKNVGKDFLPLDTALRWARLDAKEFRRLNESRNVEDAACAIVTATRNSPTYKTGLELFAPDVASKVSELGLLEEQQIIAKEHRKEIDAPARTEPPTANSQQQAVQGASRDEEALNNVELVQPRRDEELGRAIAKALDISVERFPPGSSSVVTSEWGHVGSESFGIADEGLTEKGVYASLGQLARRLDQDVEPKLRGFAAEALPAISSIVREHDSRNLQLSELRDDLNTSPSRPVNGNQVESDEVFTARQSNIRSVIPPEVEQSYRREGDKFYDRAAQGEVVFVDKGNELETRSSSEQIAESLVLIARARGWEEIKVRGSDAFKKEVWLDASSMGIEVRGYTPTEEDKVQLANRSPRQAERLEQETTPAIAASKERPSEPGTGNAHSSRDASPTDERAKAFLKMDSEKGSTKYPELRGAYLLAAAIDKQAEAAGCTPEQRQIIAAQARRNIVGSIDRGHFPTVNMREQVEVQREQVPDQSLGRSR